MIPKAEILAVAAEADLLPTTVEKDYVLGWMLYAIAEHPEMRRWLFKGGTCLKKCYFDTYRFSEDLDFTIPEGRPYEQEALRAALADGAEWIRQQAGIDFPEDGLEVRESVNRRGERTFEVRATFIGPLRPPRAARPRIRFDLTRDELVARAPEARPVFHGYSDDPGTGLEIQCYSLAEVLAEKVRALYERSGRARDVYDVVNVGRNLRSELDPTVIADIAAEKFQFKGLDRPSTEIVLGRIDAAVLETDWVNALRHQLPVLPPASEFLAGLRDVLDWLFVPERRPAELPAVPTRAGETAVIPMRWAATRAASLGVGQTAPYPAGTFGAAMDRVRYAARNRLLARITYHGVSRLVEPYSLRRPRTGNLLLYVYEVQRGGAPSGGVKAFMVPEIGAVQVTDRPFAPRYLVEL